jgi:hypothetical protein
MSPSKLPTKYDLRFDEYSSPRHLQSSFGAGAFLITGDGRVSSSRPQIPSPLRVKPASRTSSPRHQMANLMARIQTTAEENISRAMADCKDLKQFFKAARVETRFSDLDRSPTRTGFSYTCPDAASSDETIRPIECTLRTSPKQPPLPMRSGGLSDQDLLALEFGELPWAAWDDATEGSSFNGHTAQNITSILQGVGHRDAVTARPILRVTNPDGAEQDFDEQQAEVMNLASLRSRGHFYRPDGDDLEEAHHVPERPPSRHSFFDADEENDDEDDKTAEKALLNHYNRMMSMGIGTED